jgi:hypothetical protein
MCHKKHRRLNIAYASVMHFCAKIREGLLTCAGEVICLSNVPRVKGFDAEVVEIDRGHMGVWNGKPFVNTKRRIQTEVKTHLIPSFYS